MNLFWQITLIELLRNAAVFAGAVIFLYSLAYACRTPSRN
jgi:hypothetical protein